MSVAAPLPTAFDNAEPEIATLEAPDALVRRYLELTAQRRTLDDQLAYIRAELEMLAAPLMMDTLQRARFLAPGFGAVNVRVQPTCVFDRVAVAKELERAGRLADVAIVQGPSLARFLAKEPQMAARLSGHVRHRRSIVLTATG